MRYSLAFALALAVASMAGPLYAETQQQLFGSGPAATANPLPDPTHLTIKFGKDIHWTEGRNKGEFQAPLFGDPEKPGIYGLLIKWMPGSNSVPHFHTTDRYAYVVSGTWWVSSSSTYDRSKMYPAPAGSFVVDLKNKIHWDGSLKQDTSPCILLLVGEGPMQTTRYVQKDPNNMEFTPAVK
jgi:hypothetical protein